MTPLESAKDQLWEAINLFDREAVFSKRARAISDIEEAIELVIVRAQETGRTTFEATWPDAG